VLGLVFVSAAGQAVAGDSVDRTATADRFVPLSADIQITRTLVGADGEARTEHETRHLVRDGLGRTRLESGSMVTISDPARGSTVTLDTRSRTYLKTEAPDSSQRKPAATPPKALRPTISPVRQLGADTVSDVDARGYAYTITSPRPNAKPVTKELAVWTSDEVQLTVRTELVKSTGEAYRETYTDIRKGAEPRAELFTVPAGYRDAGTTANAPGATPFGTANAQRAADCPLFNAPDPVVFTEFDGGAFVQATSNPQIGCQFTTNTQWVYVPPLFIFDFAGTGAGFAFTLLAAVDDAVTPSPCGFLPCPVPGEILFQVQNGNGDVIKDSTVVLTRLTF
jgi:hypothetical protein